MDLDIDTFEDFWSEVERYAELLGVSTSYIEEEFIIDGVLVDYIHSSKIPEDYTPPEG